MDTNSIKQQMDQTVDRFGEELKKVRTGRANAAMLENVQVEAYGQKMPLNQVGTVKVLDAQMLQVSPFDPTNLEAISAAISNDQSLGLNPADDGTVVRVPIPAMTEERRLEAVKKLHEKLEDFKVSLRNVRQDALKKEKQRVGDKEISNDDYKDSEGELNELISDYNKKLDQLTKDKEEDLLKV